MVINELRKLTQLERTVYGNLLLFANPQLEEIIIPAHKLVCFTEKQILDRFSEQYIIKFHKSGYIAFKDKLQT